MSSLVGGLVIAPSRLEVVSINSTNLPSFPTAWSTHRTLQTVILKSIPSGGIIGTGPNSDLAGNGFSRGYGFKETHLVWSKSTDSAKSVKLAYNMCMESITKNVSDISLTDKLALEHVIGRQLAENQQVVIQIFSRDLRSEPAATETGSAHGLPNWCDVYAGLTDGEVEAVERTVLQRANLTQS